MLRQPARVVSTPAYTDHLNADARAHLLGAITSAYAAHDELQRADLRSALIEIDRAIVLAHEARKFLLNHPGSVAPVHTKQPELL
jgi:hypothetical protein